MDISMGYKLKRLRIQKNLSQKDVGDAVGIHQVTIGLYERNKLKPKLKSLFKLAELFGVPIREIMGDIKRH